MIFIEQKQKIDDAKKVSSSMTDIIIIKAEKLKPRPTKLSQTQSRQSYPDESKPESMAGVTINSVGSVITIKIK